VPGIQAGYLSLAETPAWICAQGCYLSLKLGPGGEPASIAWRRQTQPWLSLSLYFIVVFRAQNTSPKTSDQLLLRKSAEREDCVQARLSH